MIKVQGEFIMVWRINFTKIFLSRRGPFVPDVLTVSLMSKVIDTLFINLKISETIFKTIPKTVPSSMTGTLRLVSVITMMNLSILLEIVKDANTE